MGTYNASPMDYVPFKHKRTTLERAEKFISEHYFTDVNLRGRIYPTKAPLKGLFHCAVEDRAHYTKVLDGSNIFEPCVLGESFGPVWSTHWFKLDIRIPSEWKNKEVHLLWNSNSEALVFVDGEPRQGLSGDNGRISFPLITPKDSDGEGDKEDKAGPIEMIVHVEMACNTLFGISGCPTQRKADLNKTYTVSQAEIAIFKRDIYNLILDIETLHDMAKELPETNERGYQALYTANKMINMIDFEDENSLELAGNVAGKFFNQKNGSKKHTLWAMGHAHIDTAWLWPYAETKRKCARSWSCSLRLMEKYKDYKFVCSQAQQYDWVKNLYPSIWKDICKFVTKGQFIPVGGTWVEMDGNIPSGESCIRQFLYGQRFFMKEFGGLRCREFWLPDTFGYSAQFPQIMRHCGVRRFLTQKLSWSLVNKFPHHTFYWEGIDGSRVLAHFPPGDSYEMSGRVHEVLKSVNNFQDKGRSNSSMFLFGYGDGGNGPSEEMIERLERMNNCEGLPRIKFSDPERFFQSIEDDKMLCRWRGELYLELHNGTYTTWAQVKKYNRRSENLLRDLEILSTMACQKNPDYKYPRDDLDRMWKLLLLNQFHDVLPGTSITMVFKDAMEYYKDIEKTANELISEAARACVYNPEKPDVEDMVTYLVNTQPFPRHEVISLECYNDTDKEEISQELKEHNVPSDITQIEVKVPPLSVSPLTACEVSRMKKRVEGFSTLDDIYLQKEEVAPFGEVFVLTNGIIKACVDLMGRVVSLKRFNKTTGRWTKEAVDSRYPMNQFVIFDDIPLYWDAWDVMDYHLETRKPLTNVQVIGTNTNKLRAVIEVELTINENNTIRQWLILEAGSPYIRVDVKATWNMNRKFLKVEFPTTVHTTEATYDIQSGYLRRPNHYNTSWDSARFEVCGHKWADMSEHGFGVSIINDCKYGWSAIDGVLRLSLLRSPKNPDPEADMGTHRFSYAIMPHFGSFQEAKTIQHAIAFNNPLRTVVAPPLKLPATTNISGVCKSDLFNIDNDQVALQAIKLCEDDDKTIIVRMHEAFGGCTDVEITTGLKLKNVDACNGLELALDPNEFEKPVEVFWESSSMTVNIRLSLTSFQIVTLKCQLE